MMVTLHSQTRISSYYLPTERLPRKGVGSLLCVHYTHTQHRAHSNLLPQPQLQPPDLTYRQSQGNKIQQDPNTCISKCQRIHVDATSFVFAFPLCPHVVEGSTNRANDNNVCDGEHGIESNETPYDLSKTARGEDAEEE